MIATQPQSLLARTQRTALIVGGIGALLSLIGAFLTSTNFSAPTS